jgi:hypothetical protein
LGSAALELINGLQSDSKSPWLLPATKGVGSDDRADQGHYTGLQKVWEKVRQRAAVTAVDGDQTDAGKLVARLKAEKIRQREAEDAKAGKPADRRKKRIAELPTYTECVTAAKAAGWQFPAGMAALRLHDLRHSFASFAIADGATLYMVGKVLGHKQARTTEGYAHLADDPLRALADRTAKRISNAMKAGKGGANVLPLRGSGG